MKYARVVLLAVFLSACGGAGPTSTLTNATITGLITAYMTQHAANSPEGIAALYSDPFTIHIESWLEPRQMTRAELVDVLELTFAIGEGVTHASAISQSAVQDGNHVLVEITARIEMAHPDVNEDPIFHLLWRVQRIGSAWFIVEDNSDSPKSVVLTAHTPPSNPQSLAY